MVRYNLLSDLDGRCSSPTDCLAAAIVAAVKKEEPQEDETSVSRDAPGGTSVMPDRTHANKSGPEAIRPRHEPLSPTSDIARAGADDNASDNRGKIDAESHLEGRGGVV